MYRIAICEDEPLMAQENEAMLCRILENRHFRRNIDFTVSSFSTAGPLLTALRNQPASFHLLLLDIRLAQENGVELANYLRESDIGCSVIYITAYTEYMEDAFSTYTLGYFLKPVDEKRLAKAIDWDLRKNYRPEQIALPVNGGLRKVMVQDILYAEAVNHKADVYLPEEVISVNLSFRDLLSLLRGDTFCCYPHNFVVNLKHVHTRTTRGLLLDTGAELPISRAYQQETTKRFVTFIQ